jgi:hypothetical protein
MRERSYADSRVYNSLCPTRHRSPDRSRGSIAPMRWCRNSRPRRRLCGNEAVAQFKWSLFYRIEDDGSVVIAAR